MTPLKKTTGDRCFSASRSVTPARAYQTGACDSAIPWRH